VFCGSAENLEADHIQPKKLYPHLKYEVSNGRTLCHNCHTKTETYGGKVHKLAGVEVS
jgi:5-methylcytosine-specific restriction endonuclease McrA